MVQHRAVSASSDLEASTLDTVTLSFTPAQPSATQGKCSESPPYVSAMQVLGGRYRLDAIAGQGGFGVVWKAYDLVLKRTVAVKIPHSGRQFSVNSKRRSEKEAERLAALTHPNIVRVYDMGSDGGIDYVVSEFVDGFALSEKMASTQLSLQEAIGIVLNVSDALAHAHAHRMIHRDVKPSNILIKSDGTAMLTDFGLAITPDKDLPQQTGFVGSWMYMSPEQARAQSQLVDETSDLFSLGIVFYQLLTGQLPFPFRSRQQYLTALLSTSPSAPSTLRSGIPLQIDKVCLKCLSIAHETRWRTCTELSECLRKWLSNQPTGQRTARTALGYLLLSMWLVVCAVSASVFSGSFAPRQSKKSPQLTRENSSRDALLNPDLRLLHVSDQHAWEAKEPMRLLPGQPLDVLQRELRLFSVEKSNLAKQPLFVPELKQYAVSADVGYCVAHAGTLPSEAQFTISSEISVKQWIGRAGLVWGLCKDENALPENVYHCNSVEYYCGNPMESPFIRLCQFEFREKSPRDIRRTSTHFVSKQRTELPLTEYCQLEVSVRPNEVIIRFDAQPEIVIPAAGQILDTPASRSPGNDAAVGIYSTGDVTFQNLRVVRDI